MKSKRLSKRLDATVEQGKLLAHRLGNELAEEQERRMQLESSVELLQERMGEQAGLAVRLEHRIREQQRENVDVLNDYQRQLDIQRQRLEDAEEQGMQLVILQDLAVDSVILMISKTAGTNIVLKTLLNLVPFGSKGGHKFVKGMMQFVIVVTVFGGLRTRAMDAGVHSGKGNVMLYVRLLVGLLGGMLNKDGRQLWGDGVSGMVKLGRKLSEVAMNAVVN
eukprot:TRINITY_DN1103_c0_g1_i5.p1 TRINITY_DN1103_c0_g1~~TRINITY_DN1103_c0_g1_i5.p1  ORF type:complete len:221 (-),score=62.88 TRINITY_DN1103_c0_g1_i5:362-1024(-)